MTTLSMFYGIVIIMYNEADGRHHNAHIHARFAEFECSIDFEAGFSTAVSLLESSRCSEHGSCFIKRSWRPIGSS